MKKIMIAGVVSAALAMVVGGGAAWGVVNYLQSDAPTAGGAHKKATAEKKAHNEHESFVSLPESVVTLHDADSEDHYMLLELAMVAEDETASKKIIADEPLYQSIIVSTLSDMKYEEVRHMKVSEIKSTVMASLNSELKSRDISAPYSDVLVKKVVFQ